MRTCLRKIGIRAAAILFAASVSLALLFTACPNNAGGNKGGGTPASVSYRIIFSVDGGHGTLKAKAEGVAETDKSPISVEKDKTVTFIAAPESGYRVEKWTVTPESALQEGGTAGNPTAKVKITANTKVNVSFTNDLYTVTLESLDSAKKDAVIKAVSEITGRSLEEAKTLVENAPQVFKEDVTAAEAGEIIAKITEAGGTASKSRKTYPVIFSVEGTPASGTLRAEVDGTVIHTTNEVEYDKTVIFTAAPAADYEVGKWKITGGTFEAGTGTDGKLIAKVKITAATTVNVSFTLKTYPVTFSVKGTPANGTLKADLAGTVIHTNDKVEYGKTVTFTAKPAAGYTVDKWKITGGTFEAGTGTDGNTTAKVKITADTQVNVSFTEAFIVEMTHGEHGTLSANPAIPPSGKVAKDTKITFTAVPEPGYKVDTWTITGGTFEAGTGTDGNTTAKVWITADTKVNVSFTNTYPVTFSVKGTPANGTLKADLAGTVIHTNDKVEYGKTVTFTADPATGYKVDKWTITPASALQEGGTAGSQTAKVKITADTNVNVSFTLKTYPVTFSVDGGHGTLKVELAGSAIASGQPVEYGKTVTFTAAPAPGYKVDTWTITPASALQEGGTNGSTTAKVKITAATTVNVSFTLKTYPVTFSVDGEHGTLTAKVDGNEISSDDKVEHGKIVTFSAMPNNPQYTVDSWSINEGSFEVGTGGSGSTNAQVKVEKPITVRVKFKLKDVGSFEDAGYFVKIIPPANGIKGVYPDYPLPETDNPYTNYKGVFYTSRIVKLSPYKLGKTEVTYKLWKEVYDWAVVNGYRFLCPGQKGSSGTGDDEEPVTNITWRDCIAWCNAYTEKTMGEEKCVYREKDDHSRVIKIVSHPSFPSYASNCDNAYADMTKKGYRLPTEAEWEYAARWQGRDETNAVQCGDTWLTKLDSASGAKDRWDTDETKAVAWYEGNSDNKTHPVGKRRANALGLHDMSGNVFEWCFDRYRDIYYLGSETDPQGAESGSDRVRRGGGYNAAKLCTVGIRFKIGPDYAGEYVGFRLACRP